MSDNTPAFNKRAFQCPSCGTVAQMVWHQFWNSPFEKSNNLHQSDFFQSACVNCSQKALWHAPETQIGAYLRRKGVMVWPLRQTPAPKPHADLPKSCLDDYIEATNVCSDSPRAAAALLRLCIQRLCTELGEKGENINADIAALVQKGLPNEVRQALDVVRVVGNNAVHPGEMQLSDTPEIALSLFGLVNFIVDRMITQPRQIEALHNLLPAGTRAAIERRDAK